MDSLLITRLQCLGKTRGSNKLLGDTYEQSLTKSSVFTNNKLPLILEKSKENFMKHMVNVETKYANVGQIEEYYTNKINKVNDIYNHNVDLIENKKNYLLEIDFLIQKEVQQCNIIDYGDCHNFYDKKMKHLQLNM